MKRQAVNTQQPINRAHPLARGLRGWWLTLPQWYGGSKWYDLCGLNPGTLTAMTSTGGWRPPISPGGNGSVLFDGTDDYIALPDILNAPTALTITVWAKIIVVGTLDCFAAKYVASPENGWALETGTGGLGGNGLLLAASNAGSHYGHVNSVLTAGQVVHLAYVFDGAGSGNSGRLKLYMNGKPVTLSYTGTIPSSIGSNAVAPRIGANADGRFGNFQIDDVQFRNVALSAAEVFALYNESRLGYPGLLNRWEWPLAGEEAAAATVPYRMLLGVGV